MRQHRDPDLDHETPPAVVTAVAIGTAPLPFLAVYAVLFILHGTISPSHPPDITSSQEGELIAGVIAALIFIVVALTIWMFLGGRRRWPYAIGQLAVIGTTVWFLVDETKGGPVISAVLLAASAVSLVFGFSPDGWTHVGRVAPRGVSRLYGRRVPREAAAGDPAALPGAGEPSAVATGRLRRRRSESD